MNIEEKLKTLPASPGVYVMKGISGEILYIGKAKSLRSRVRSYFRKGGDERYAVKFLAAKVADIGFIVTASEKEALLLEDTLCKRHRPKYNIRLKDSKTYVSIKLTVNERFPRISVTRHIKKDGARYFGPYVSARDVRGTIKLLRKVFALCACSPAVFRNRVRPCLDFQLGLCSAPAAGLIGEAAYAKLVKGAVMFLEGRNAELMKALKEQMAGAAKALDFEEAARLRDKIAAIDEMLEKQRVVSHRGEDQDVFAMARGPAADVMQTLLIRGGRLAASGGYSFKATHLPDDELLSSFITEYYRGGRHIPDAVIVPVRLDDAPLIREWLSEKAGRRIALITPVKGDKSKLLEMARVNALETLKKKEAAPSTDNIRASSIEALKKRLRLKNPPEVIEAFDISNIGADLAAGAMVTFANAEPDKSRYRLYRIRNAAGPDDYAMMQETLTRRYSGGGNLPLPGLILIDGGKGQLNIAVKVLSELGLKGKVEVAALAKDKGEAPRSPEESKGLFKKPAAKGERIYLPNVKDPILLREGSAPDLLLRRIRDEVHRFAVSYIRRLKSRTGIGSVLDNIPGIGPKKRKALFERFASIEGIRNSSAEELTAVDGITEKLARAIKEGISKNLH
ncbi:MAG: excinuclease ABC subunit UvrC [Deltaproteobacteria bacterium]|nr:excinuclease ABC subunit UvrC [Deltaproteobacteria bacterium]